MKHFYEQLGLPKEYESCNQLQTSLSFFDMASAVHEYFSAALADNTRLAYQGDLMNFIEWGGTIPSSPEILACYISERARLHSPFTIIRRVVGISRAHTTQGFPDPAKNDLVRTVLRGIRRKHGMAQRQVAPLLKQDIIAMIPNGSDAKSLRDRALILLGFASALRRTELVSLNVNDIEFVSEGLILHQRRSKTDQEAIGRKIAIPHARGLACPVKSIAQWLTCAEISEGAVFRSVDKSGSIRPSRLTSQSVALILKHYATRAGINYSNISGHSLRSGLITSAAIAGVPIWKIKAQSGHRSDAMLSRYIRDASIFEGNASGALL